MHAMKYFISIRFFFFLVLFIATPIRGTCTEISGDVTSSSFTFTGPVSISTLTVSSVTFAGPVLISTLSTTSLTLSSGTATNFNVTNDLNVSSRAIVNRLLASNGTLGAPTISFSNDTDTGIWRGNTNNEMYVSIGGNYQWGWLGGQVNLYHSGTSRYEWTSSYYIPQGDNTITLGQSGNRWTAVWATNGTIQTSSSLLKKQIREIDLLGKGAVFKDVDGISPAAKSKKIVKRLGQTRVEAVRGEAPVYDVPRGIIFKWKNTPSTSTANADVIGFMGEDLPLEAHALREDGTRDPESFYTSAVIGLLCAKVRAQDAIIKELISRVENIETTKK